MCYCASDCYSSGLCCPDVGYLKNCLVSVEECATGDVRLVGGIANSSSGLLEVCVNGVWGTVCDYVNEWNHENAAVVCHQLNLPTSNAKMLPSSMFDSTPHGPILLDKVHCNGDEEMLMDCSHSSIGNHFCSQFLQDESSNVAIQCAADCEEGKVRLQDGTDPSNGRVEVCHHGIWGSVCSNQWNISKACVLCKQLGFECKGTVQM
jgi:deleted-in-malignant-brain-tumors protein 1